MALFYEIGGPDRQTTKLNVLMVAEYSSIALAIAERFPNRATSVQKRQWPDVAKTEYRYGPFFVYEFDAKWPGNELAHFKMLSTMGRMVEWDFVEAQFKDRAKTGGNGELFLAPIEKVPRQRGRTRKILNYEAADCDRLILWLNCDKMGDSTCLDVVEAIGWKPDDDRIQRARYFGITETDIKRALCNLERIDMRSAISLDAMHVVDFRIGCAFTRLLTQRCSRTREIVAEMVPFGPVMTPSLGLIVQRYQECEKATPTRHWELVCTAKRLGPSGFIESKFKIPSECIGNKQLGEEMLARLGEFRGKTVTISVTSEFRYESKPMALTSLELMRQASSRFRIVPEETIRRAEELYLQGKSTYPRTESVVYPSSYFESGNIVRALENLRHDPKWQLQVIKLMRFDFSSPISGSVSYGTAPPIMPLDKYPSNVFLETDEGLKPVYGPKTEIDSDREHIHQLIVENFLTSIAEKCLYAVKVARFKIGGLEFSASENVIEEPGFTAFMPENPINEAKYGFQQDQEFTIVDIALESREEAPSLMTVVELLSKLEEHRFGGHQSTAWLIEMLVIRGYVIVDPETHQIRPTPRGKKVIEIFQKHAPSLLKPDLRSQMEAEMRQISNDKEYNAAVTKWIKIYKTEFDDFRAKWLVKSK